MAARDRFNVICTKKINNFVNERAIVFSFSSSFITPRTITKRCFWTPTVVLKVEDILNIRMVK